MNPESLSVLHLDDGRQWRGGQHQVTLLVRGLAERGGRQVVAVSPRGPLAHVLGETGPDGRVVGRGDRRIHVCPVDFSGEMDLGSVRNIVELAVSNDVRIIHAHTAHTHTLGLRAQRRLAKRLADPPRLVITRRVDFAVGRGFFSSRKYRSPEQHFIAISGRVRDVLIEGGVDPGRIDVVPSGVPPLAVNDLDARRRIRAEFSLSNDDIAIVNVGALTDHKGQRWLVKAAPGVIDRFPNAKILIFGEGELRSDLEASIDALGLTDKVRLPGHVEGIRDRLDAFDLYVHSSHLEGLGTSILDAMLAGLPVVAAEAGGVVDIVRHGETGLLAATRSSKALSSAIVDALRMSEGEREALADRGRTFAAETFSVDQMVEGTFGVYMRVLAGAGSEALAGR